MSFPDEKAVYSYQDWQTWEGNWEWINGKAYSMSPAPTPLHQSVVGELHFALRAYFQRRSCQVFVAPFRLEADA
ncbi:Uma2 family endonuclease [Paenibacillus sp. B01]|uniref:Uma2 family endonuclease n=1 Tax=Paenibacillus sp. B01 TaxID=2660554 RepID=UPI00129ABB1A|nr:Uma2 family endonuclease [Paenibacillus sp. B01]QGG57465.1 hypothetical protein GE073_18925 [Paenibacillus sp. B01]